MKKPLISVLTPTYNRAKNYLSLTIESVLGQNTPNFDLQYVIVDNCSTDKTAHLVKRYTQKDRRVLYIKNTRNIGPGDGLNVALRHAKGDWVVPLDDDDLLPRNSLSARINFHKANKQAQWSYGYSLFIDQDNCLWTDLLEFNTQRKFYSNTLKDLLERCFIPNGTVTVARKAVEKVGGWDTQVKTQDYDMWLKLAAAHLEPHLIETYLCLYRVHKQQIGKVHKNTGVYIKEKEMYRAKYKELI
jgi:glycosyltransferase involved in cell wall biosynthesis